MIVHGPNDPGVKEKIIEALSNGSVIPLLCRHRKGGNLEKYRFACGEHFYVLYRMDNGEIRVKNPNHSKGSKDGADAGICEGGRSTATNDGCYNDKLGTPGQNNTKFTFEEINESALSYYIMSK